MDAFNLSLTDLCWLATAAYGLHILEEFVLNWRDWARNVLGLPVDWPVFYVVNALVMAFGIIAASLAATQPALALAFPAVMLVNGTVFHVLPFLRTRGRFSPGLISAVVLFYPLALACYWRAAYDSRVGAAGLVGSLVLGAVLMACPVVLLLVKDRPYFRQDHA
jgi:hypothetical protein